MLRTYDPADFSQFDILGYDLVEASQVNQTFYFKYTNERGNMLYLAYRDNALVEQTFYHRATDTMLTIQGKEVKRENNFFGNAHHG